LDEEIQHVRLALGVARLDREDVARGVVEERVDAQRPAHAGDLERRSVAHVAVPERPWSLSLPAEALGGSRAASLRHAVESVLAAQSAQRGGGARVAPGAAVRDQGPQDEGHRRRWVFASDVEDQLALLLGGLAGPTAIVARHGPQRRKAALPESVEPA